MNRTEKPVIRAATPADTARLVVLCRKTFYDTYHADNTESDTMKYLDEHFSQGVILEELNDEHVFIFVCELEGKLTGYITFRSGTAPEMFKGHTCLEIARFYVDTQYQGKKIGNMLMQRCFDYALVNHVELLWLGVWQKNKKAIDIYNHMGFQIAGVTTFTFGEDIQDDYIMAKEIQLL